jgi:hypothetical protein
MVVMGVGNKGCVQVDVRELMVEVVCTVFFGMIGGVSPPPVEASGGAFWNNLHSELKGFGWNW